MIERRKREGRERGARDRGRDGEKQLGLWLVQYASVHRVIYMHIYTTHHRGYIVRHNNTIFKYKEVQYTLYSIKQ